MNKIFYIMGKSASGKDKIYKKLLEHETLDLQRLVLYTTRPIRIGEQHGQEYYFVDESALTKFKEEGHLIESRAYNTVGGIWTYFTADDGQVDLEHHSYLGIGTLESYEKMREYYGDEVMCPLYIQVEDAERLRRAIKREEKQENPAYEEVCRRFLADAEDFSETHIARAGICQRFKNNDLEECTNQIVAYINCQ